MKPSKKKIKHWIPAKEFKVIKLPREEPPDSSGLLNEHEEKLND